MHYHRTSKYHRLHFVESAKVLSVTMRDEFKWNDHNSAITIWAATRQYFKTTEKS